MRGRERLIGLTSTAVHVEADVLYVELTAHAVSPPSDEDACRSTGLNVGRYSRTHAVLTLITGAGRLLTALYKEGAIQYTGSTCAHVVCSFG